MIFYKKRQKGDKAIKPSCQFISTKRLFLSYVLKIFRKTHFLPSDKRTYMCVKRGKKR